MALGEILRERREKLGLTLDEVADYTGFSKPYLSTIETGKVNNPPSDTLLRELEKILRFTKGQLQHLAHVERMPADIRRDYEAIDAENRHYRTLLRGVLGKKVNSAELKKRLRGFDLQKPQVTGALKAGHLVPVINKVSAGYPGDFDDLGYPAGFADDYVRCPDLHDPNAFAVRVVGDSMEPKYSEGDIVVFSPAIKVENGDDCFIRFSSPHETTFKRVFFESKKKVRLQPRNENYPPLVVEMGKINGMYRAVIKYQRL